MRVKGNYTLSELSAQFDLDLRGDRDCEIDGVGTLMSAGPGQITFLANPSYRKELPATKATAVILRESDVAACPTHCLVATDPYLAYARLATLFDSRPEAAPGIHATAVIDESTKIGSDISIGPNVVIGAECEIGNGCTIGAGTVIDVACCVGAGSHLHANVTLGYGVRLGQRVIIHPGAVIGADGFGIAFATDHWEKVPQLGSVVVGDDCEIGCNTTIDRGAIGDTILEDDVRIDNLCQIGHNVQIGAHTAMGGMAGVAGSTKIGRYCLFGGGSGASGHLEIADKTIVAANSVLFRSVDEKGKTWSAQFQAQPIRNWQRNVSRFLNLDKMATRIRNLETKLEKLENNE
jgi:UDP-3-O-[3-hydroxymyristoyl] glucosamine N-acyltransferase